MPGLLELILLLLAVQASTGLDDQALARKIKEGDQQAFRAFFDRYHGLLYRYLRARHVPGAVCEDLMQNAFLAIWERRREIDENQSLRAFLFRICYNRALNHFRDRAKFSDLPEGHEPAAPVTPDRRADAPHLQATLQRTIEALPERRRAVFELCFLHELTYREAAQALGVSVKTVENQMGHALKAVRAALQEFV